MQKIYRHKKMINLVLLILRMMCGTWSSTAKPGRFWSVVFRAQ